MFLYAIAEDKNIKCLRSLLTIHKVLCKLSWLNMVNNRRGSRANIFVSFMIMAVMFENMFKTQNLKLNAVIWSGVCQLGMKTNPSLRPMTRPQVWKEKKYFCAQLSMEFIMHINLRYLNAKNCWYLTLMSRKNNWWLLNTDKQHPFILAILTFISNLHS